MTLKEIALRAGVSVSTVSRIINSPDDSFARKPLRDKVWAIVKETGYIPNQSARELKRGLSGQTVRTRTLAFILGRARSVDDNPFFAQVSRAVEQQALSVGYSVSTSYSIFDIGDKTLQSHIETQKTDGAVVLGRFTGDTRKFFEKHYKNLVFIGRNPIDANWDQVICDGYEASATAMRHLISLGHRRIGYIGETSQENRYRAYADMVSLHKLDDERSLVSPSAQDGAGGYVGAKNLLKSAKPLPTAVFCATDVSAIAAMKCFAEAGVKIPKQLSVISIDDIELAQYVSPALTTVSVPKVELGNVAVTTLIDRINKSHKMPMKIFLPHKLIVRESTAEPN